MSVSTYYTGVGDTVDGRCEDGTNEVTWATKRGLSASSYASSTEAEFPLQINTSNVTNRWRLWSRAFFLFDTSDLGGDIISAATMEIRVNAKNDDFSESISFVTSSPASDTALVVGDFDQLGTTKNATDITISSVNADGSTANVFTLNATGLGNISKDGISKFGMKITADNDDNEPTWAQDDTSSITILSDNEGVAGDQRPRLIVTHVSAFTPKAMMF